MAECVGVTVAAVVTLGFGLWVALAWSLRDRAARVLALTPGVYSQPELAYGPFWVAMAHAASLSAREPRVFVPLAVFSLLIVLGGRAPTSLFTDEEILEQEDRALARLRVLLAEAEDEEDEDDE